MYQLCTRYISDTMLNHMYTMNAVPRPPEEHTTIQQWPDTPVEPYPFDVSVELLSIQFISMLIDANISSIAWLCQIHSCF